MPTEGNDEFAALGSEFNAMARQLEGRLEELQRERARLQEAIRRVGESFAKGLDRVGLLEIVVQTAVDGIEAAVRPRDHAPRRRRPAARGRPHRRSEGLRAGAARRRGGGAGRRPDRRDRARRRAARWPRRSAPSEGGDRVVGIVSVARGDRRFTPGERELFAYLTNQASVSVENVDLHETVQRQAVTDELTGLFNHRRFQEVMSTEVERARRYEQEMGLIMLDIDNFKRVNDTYGHMQGDMVLREVARVLRQSSREIDEPARYGGEEMAVALPQTDLEGAYRFAERVRRRIEALDLPLLDGDGTLKVTASFGAASLQQRRADGQGRAGRGRRRRAVPRQAVRQEPHGRGRVTLAVRERAWDCSTTPSASTWSSSAATAPTRTRSPARSARRSGAPRSRRVRAARGRARPAGGRARAPRPSRPQPAVPEAAAVAAPAGRRSPPSRAAAAGAPSRAAPEPSAPPRPPRRPRSGGPSEEPWLAATRSPPRRPLEHPAATPEGEDVLEETPEFLQETPEHDRLWFEQKPPRDFDWDK